MRADEILTNAKEYDELPEDTHPDQQNRGIVVLLEQHKMLQKLVACWPNVMLPQDSDPTEKAPESIPDSHQMRWLWSRIEPDPVPGWIELAGLPNAPHVRRLAQQAIDNRMVFPDGTLSKWARRFVATRTNVGGG